jgi:MarR family 2-MHQ and catechol resistance regulon transcriptional repressor
VDRLEAKGLVERFNDKQDRRSRIVRLTAAGRKTIQKAFADHKIAMEAAASGLDRKDRAVLIGLLRRLGQTAEKQLAEQKSTSATRRNEEEQWQS